MQIKIFFKNIKTILTGSVFEKFLLILFTPALTRFYTPEFFAIFSLFSSIVSVFCSLTCLKFENLIVITKEENKIPEILKTTFFVAIFISLLAYLSLNILYQVNFEPILKIKEYILIIFLTVLLSNTSQIFNHYFIRYSQFSRFNYIKILNTSSFILFSIIGYYLNFSFNSLIVGYLIGFVFSNIFGIYYVRFKVSKIEISNILNQLQKNKDLTVFDSIGSFIHNFSSEIPVFLLSIYFSNQILGFYALVIKVFLLPISILSRTIGTANYKYLTDLTHNNQKIFSYVLKLTISLFSLTIIPIICCYYFAEPFIIFVFGKDWSYSAKILQILSTGYALKFVALTLFETAYPIKLIKTLSIWKFVSTLIFLTVCLSYLNFYEFDNFGFFHLLNSLELIINFFLIAMILYKAKKYDERI